MGISLTFAFGLLGNIVSFMVFLSPVPTFIQIYKRKSSEGFQCVPYVVGLFSAMMWIYYALLKPDTTLLITINSVGCFIQTVYICFFLVYASRNARIKTMKVLFLLNVGGLGAIVLLTQILVEGLTRASIVGWICLVFSLCVFVAPLCVVSRVIRTKSVEYMPFLLSFFLTLSAVMWFFYGLLLKDYNIAIPNVLGFGFGVLQMVLYIIYKNSKKVVNADKKIIPQVKEQIIEIVTLSGIVNSDIIPGVVPVVVPRLIDECAIKLEEEKKTKPSIETVELNL